ncbi:hypothetical protein EGYY_09020 [Eggerthella sp. YY7918]|nr:hypothetical protein EGYY_09020 [Eggerthella sp. YY7918]
MISLFWGLIMKKVNSFLSIALCAVLVFSYTPIAWADETVITDSAVGDENNVDQNETNSDPNPSTSGSTEGEVSANDDTNNDASFENEIINEAEDTAAEVNEIIVDENLSQPIVSDVVSNVPSDSYAALDALAAENRSVVKDGVYSVSSAKSSSAVLDVKAASTANGANVQLHSSNGTDAQVWIITHDAAGYLTIASANSGKVLDVKAAKAASGTNVQQHEPNGTRAQKWIAVADGESIKLVSALSESYVLDAARGDTANGTNVQIHADNGTAAQRWVLSSTKTMAQRLDVLANDNRNVVADGQYVFRSAKSSSAVLDVKAASTANGANVQLHSSNGTDAQVWIITHDAAGYLTIASANSGKVLDVKAAKAASGTNVQQHEPNGTRAQKWIAVADGESIKLVSALSESYVLDAARGDTANGTNVQIHADNGTAAQRWVPYDACPVVEPCKKVIDSGWFALATPLNPSKVIDIASASQKDGANAQLHFSNGTLAQIFYLEWEDGWYTIRNARSDKLLHVDNGAVLPGTNVHQWSGSNENAQWSVSKSDDGSYNFVNRASGLALGVDTSKVVDGTNVQGCAVSEASSQKWLVVEQKNLLPEGIYTLVSALSSLKVVDVTAASDSDGANVQLYDRNDTPAQKWEIKLVGGKDNTYTLRSLASGKCLAVDDSGNVCQFSCDVSAPQPAVQWTLNIKAGRFEMTNVLTSKVLETANGSYTAGANIQVGMANDSKAQQFEFAAVPVLSNGTYSIKSALGNDQVIDVSSGQLANGANIQTFENNGTGAQKWNITSIGDGYFKVVNAKSGKALDVKSANAVAGANIQQHVWNNTAAQKWKLTPTGDGYYCFMSALDEGLCLEVAGSSPKNLTNVCLGVYSGSASQKFRFAATTYKLTMSDRVALLNSLSSSSAITPFGGASFDANSASGRSLVSALNSIRNNGYQVGFVMMDLNTGAGLASMPTHTFYVASSIKGPYVAAINKYAPGGVTSYWRNIMYQTITVSSNEGYASLRNSFGNGPMSSLMGSVGVKSWAPSTWYPHLNTRDLSKLWLATYDYFYVSTNSNSAWCRSLYTHSLNSVMYNALGGKYMVHSKPGWIADGPAYTAQNDGGIVMVNGHPYLLVVMSTAYGQYGKLQTLVNAIDSTHASIFR